MDILTDNIHRLLCVPACFSKCAAILAGTLCTEGSWMVNFEGFQPESLVDVLPDVHLDVPVSGPVVECLTFTQNFPKD